MENYIGVKIVIAEPLAKDGILGYHVKYPDEHISWIQKGIFEKEYRKLDCEDFISSKE